MTRFLAAILLLGAFCAPRPVSANGMIFYTQGPTRISGYPAIPRGEGTHPGVVLVHEWWGLSDWVKEQADSLANKGYVAIAADLYRGQVAHDDETAHQLMSGLVDEDVIRILRA